MVTLVCVWGVGCKTTTNQFSLECVGGGRGGVGVGGGVDNPLNDRLHTPERRNSGCETAHHLKTHTRKNPKPPQESRGSILKINDGERGWK